MNNNLNRRHVWLAGLALLAAPASAQASARGRANPPRVLFVCAAGTAKSAIARELLRRRARERGIAVSVFSRGLHIENHVSLLLRDQLAADGIDVSRDPPTALARRDVHNADMIVAFTPLPAKYRTRVIRDWSAVPSVNEAYPAARADLDKRIEALLDQIAAERKALR